MRELYRALCFDEPLLDGIPNLTTAASALSRQLTSASSPYALSNRLVNGIVYLCRQRSNQTGQKAATTSNDDNSSSFSLQERSNAVNNSTATQPTTALALAKLAFCVLVQVPLECCEQIQSKNILAVQNYIGSYNGTTTDMPTTTERSSPDNNDDNDDTSSNAEAKTNSAQIDQRVNQLTEALAGLDSESVSSSHGDVHHDNNIIEDDNSALQEVWAAESDASDYDYGEGDVNDTAAFSHFPQSTPEIVDMLDPMLLSKQNPSLTMDEARTAIGSLLQQANYSILAPLFQLSQKQVETYISQLTQLLLLLLQPPQSILVSDGAAAEGEASSSSSSLQDAMLTPLWILRDAALHHPSHEQSFYTSSYMEVLQTLLAVDQAYQSDAAITPNRKTQSGTSLCSASIVGLSALSSWCCSAQIFVPATTTAILDSMNDLAHVMERASESGYRENLKHSMTPILEILTGITYQDRKIIRSQVVGSSTTVEMMIPQTMLNSGFLRQLLTLSLEDVQTTTNDDTSPSSGSPPYHLDHALWGLCVVYPTVVGKYVARYPGFSSIVRRYHRNPPETTTSRDCVHSILWNCFAFVHCSDGSQPEAPRIVWKTKAPSSSSPNGIPTPQQQATPLTKDECREVCQKSWARLIQMVESSLVVAEQPSSPKEALDVVQDWERLLKLVGVPSIVATFQSLLSDHDTQLEAIRRSLSQTEAGTKDDSSIEDSRNKNEKLDDEDDDDRKKSTMTHQQLVAATTRKVLKQYTLFFQGNAGGSSKTD